MHAVGLIVYSPVSASITPYHYYGHYISQDVLTLKEGQDLLSLSGLRCCNVTYNIHSKTNQPKHGYLLYQEMNQACQLLFTYILVQ